MKVLRPSSSSRIQSRYNPILPSEQPVVMETRGKALVNQTFFYSKYPEERPKGRSITPFSKYSQSSHNFFSSELNFHKPSIKVKYDPVLLNYTKPQSIRTAGYDSVRHMKSRPKYEGISVKNRGNPSPMLRYANERKNFLPSTMGFKSKIPDSCVSKIFSNENSCYLFNGRLKTLLSKPTEISSVIKYDYALPYREQKVTGKP